MQSATITITVILILTVLLVPRKWFLLPFVMCACIVPADQRIIIMDLDFTPLRMIVLFGMIKLFATGQNRQIRWNPFDKLILAWVISGTIIYIIQWQDMRAVIYKCGVMFDCFGLYYLFRQNLRKWDDVIFTIKLFAFFAIFSAPLIIYERVTEQSLFANFGRTEAMFHRGRFRCSGPFPHAIMMGLFWANLLPLYYGCAKAGKSKFLFYTAIVSALICVYLSGSSTPIMTAMAIFAFWFFYRFRKFGKYITIGIAVGLAGLHIVMKAPVWHLIARVNIFSGSTGWHRFQLIDETVSHFEEWALFGCRGVEHWGIWLGDVTNQYILEAVTGGLLTMLIFIFIMGYAIRASTRGSLSRFTKNYKWICWGMAVSLLGHCVSFFGVSYFGQIIMLLYLQFACVSFINQGVIRKPVPAIKTIRKRNRVPAFRENTGRPAPA